LLAAPPTAAEVLGCCGERLERVVVGSLLRSGGRAIVRRCPTPTTTSRLPTRETSPRQSPSRCAIVAGSACITQMNIMATIPAAERIVEHLTGAGFVAMKKPPLDGHSVLGRGFEG